MSFAASRRSSVQTVCGIAKVHTENPRAQTARLSHRPLPEMTIQEMEEALKGRPAKKIASSSDHRELFEVNRQLIEVKQQKLQLKKKVSREFVQKLLGDDYAVIEENKAREHIKRQEREELAQAYKDLIRRNEEEKLYNRKADQEAFRKDIGVFPLFKGDSASKSEEKKSQLRDEMRMYLQQQRELHPPREDNWLKAAPAGFMTAREMHEVRREFLAEKDLKLLADAKIPHLSKYPRFLTKAQTHICRRPHDGNVRKAMEGRVDQTKTELVTLAHKRHTESVESQFGLLLADALRYDNTASKADERRQHAHALREQIEDRKRLKEQQEAARKAEKPGYWGQDTSR